MLLLTIAVCGGLSACGDEQSPPAASGATPTAPASRSPSPEIQWLELNAPISPERWLASRGLPESRDAQDAEVLRVGQLLDRAHSIYRESRRMIANRAVQVEQMLKERGMDGDAIAALEDLAAVAGEVGQTEGFGALSQHYVNLRAEPMDRAAALAKLKELYGKRP